MPSPTAGPTDAGTCPPDSDLTAFLDEALPADRQAALGDHIDRCPGCQARLDALARDPSGTVDRYRRLTSTPPHTFLPLPLPPPDPAKTRIINGPAVPANVTFDALPAIPGFEILGEIGRGGMGVVYKARHKQLNRLCALKVVIAGGAADARTVQRFLFEAEVLARIQHPQVVQVYDVGTYRGPSGVPIPYLAMELLEGGTLAAFAARRPQPPRTAAALAEGLARAVHAVHLQGIVHRDLKPGNILFNAECGMRNAESKIPAGGRPGEGWDSAFRIPHSALPKVSDFGLAKFTEGAAELTGSGMIVGTPGYMAPEQAAGVKRIGPAADVYALGAILFELLTGRPPFDGTEPMSVLVKVVNGRPPDVRSLRPDCPRDLAAVAMLCLEKDPDRRYPSAEALADDLARYLANRPTAARRPHPVEQFAMAVRRNPVAAGLLFLLVATFAAAIGVAAVQWRLAVAAVEAERASRAVAEDALTEAGDERRRADGRQMLLEFDRAARRCEEGQVGQGVAGFVTALELAEKLGDADRARVARVNLAAWQARLFQQMYSVRHAEKGRARAVAFTPDGAALVTAGDFATLRLWDAATGRPVRELVPSVRHFRGLMITPTFWAVAVNPAGTRVAVGGSDGQVWVWDPGKPDSRTAWPATPPGGEVWSLTFAPDGSLWTGDDGGRVRRWDADTGKSLADLPTQVRAVVTAVVVSRDGTRLLAADRAGGVSEWDVPGRREVRRYTPEGAGWVTDVALSPDETLLAATGTYATADVWDRATGARVAGFDLAGAHGTGVAFAPDGRHLVAADNGGIVRAWDRTARGPTFPPLRVPGAAQPVRFRPGTRAFAVPAGSTVGVWRLPAAGGADLGRPDGEPIRALDFDPAGKRLLVVRRNLEVYDSETAAAAAARTYAVKTPSLTARFDPHRPRLVRTDRGGWWAVDAETGAESRPAGWERSYVDQLEFAPGGAGFLTGDPTAVFAWDAAGRDRRRLPASDRLTSSEPLRVLRYRSDGKEIMVGAADRLEFLDPATGHPTREPIALPDAVEDACYTPDGSRVVVGLRNATARVWNLATGTPDGEPLPHASAVACVAVSPDGATLLTGSRDGTARFWDAATGLALGPPLRHATAVTAVAFSPDGRRAATGTVGSRARLWDAPPAPAAGPPADFRGRGAGTTP